MLVWSWIFCIFAALTFRAEAQTRPSMDDLDAMAASLHWQTGPIDLKDGLAKINLTDDFRFLGSADARKVLHDMWGNPDDPDLLGMIFPKDKGPLDRGSWAVMVTYRSDGYVKDDDAEKINYTDMLAKMQQAAKDANPEREKEGYPSVELIGWAAPPHYDKTTHKLYWAKELNFGGQSENTLNYDIRVLGRRGVLILEAISSMAAFPEIQDKMPQVISMVDFKTGNTYADFDPNVDKVAEYGLATLVAGGALATAAKLGLFGLIAKYFLVAILALKKAVIFVVVAIVAAVKKVWGKISGKTTVKPPGQ
jgi:uncharacterized membrane-anchored protein